MESPLSSDLKIQLNPQDQLPYYKRNILRHNASEMQFAPLIPVALQKNDMSL